MIERNRTLTIAVLITVVVFGFRFAAQAGLTGQAGTIQNDGYAGVGGFMILLGGLGLGYVLATVRGNKKGKR